MQIMPGTKAIRRQSALSIQRNLELWKLGYEAEQRRKKAQEKKAKG